MMDFDKMHKPSQGKYEPIQKPRMLSVVEQYADETPKKKGHIYAIRCPFHNDGTASFFVYPNHGHCYGCNWHGDAIDFVQKIKNISFQDALAELNVESKKIDDTPFTNPFA